MSEKEKLIEILHNTSDEAKIKKATKELNKISLQADSNIPDGITREMILEASKLYDGKSLLHRFHDSRDFDVIIDGKTYPPKAIIGIASKFITRVLHPSEFSAGYDKKCFKILIDLGFKIKEKHKLENEKKLEINSVYTQEDIKNILDITIMKGMNFKINKNRLILIRNHVKSIYLDRQEGDILYYTGEGTTGNQSLTGANRRLLDSNKDNTEVYLFEVFEKTKYTYKGLVFLLKEPLIEQQTDIYGNNRSVYVFPLKLNTIASINNIENIEKAIQINNKRIKSLSNDELERRIKQSQKESSGYTYSKTTIYQRSPYIVEYVLRRAHGICELCEQKAPFCKPNGEAYLEVHHIIQLAKGGPDTTSNTVALCPNCHRKMHSLNKTIDIKKLESKAKSFDVI